jgi:putative flavoprotein involved in K+ transport
MEEARMTEQINTIIVGGGQAGLATSYFLKLKGIDHIIIEKADQAASAWRERWDSFTLITPNWMIRLPGSEYAGHDLEGFTVREDVIAYFEEYIQQHDLPIRFGTRVSSIEPTDDGYLVKTDKEEFEAANVVIATGMYQEPKVPLMSERISSKVRQLHSSEYRNPDGLPEGAVLVVGSAQSGCQIAEELYQSGRKVYLSVGNAGRVPRRYRGKDITTWFDELGFYDRSVDKLPSPKAKYAGSVHGTGKDGGHTINLHQFAKDGVELLGHIRDAEGDRIILEPDLKDNIALADKFETKVVNEIDAYIESNGLDAPLEVLPELTDGYDVDDILELDLKSVGIRSVIWATGYKFDFSMVKVPTFDEDGYPLQKRGATEFPGLYFIGLQFLHNAKSGLLAGVGDDAAHVASAIETPNQRISTFSSAESAH